MGVIINSKLSPAALSEAFKVAWPDEGFHVRHLPNGRHDIIPDKSGHTAAELQAAADAWRGDVVLANARKVAAERVRQIMANHLMRFLPVAAPASEDAASKAWGAHVFAVSTNGLRLIEEIGKSATPDEIDLSLGWPK